MAVNRYTGKVILLLVLFSFLLLTGAGCAADPMVSYLEEIEEKGIIDDIELIEDDYRSLNNEIDRLFEAQLEELSTDSIEAAREEVNTLIDKQADILAKISALETGSEEVEKANNYLIEAINNQISAANMFHIMFDLFIELVTIAEDPGRPGVEEDLDRIAAEAEEAERVAFEYLVDSDDAINAWVSIVEGN